MYKYNIMMIEKTEQQQTNITIFNSWDDLDLNPDLIRGI